MQHLFNFIIFLSTLSLVNINARELPELNSHVIDEADVLSFAFKKRLQFSLSKYQKENEVRLQVVILESLRDETIESISKKILSENNEELIERSALFLISISDRKLKITPGQALGSIWSSKLPNQIIQSAVPFFKRNAHEEGLLVSIHQMASASGSDLDGMPLYQAKRSYKQYDWILIVILIILLMIFGRGRKNRKSWVKIGSVEQKNNHNDLSIKGKW